VQILLWARRAQCTVYWQTGGRFRTREHIHMKCVPIVHSHQHTIGVYDPYKFTLPSTSRSSSISSVSTCYSCFPFRKSSLKLTLVSRVGTLCTTTLKFPHSVPTMHLCILCESQSKWRSQGTIDEPSTGLYRMYLLSCLWTLQFYRMGASIHGDILWRQPCPETPKMCNTVGWRW
jgi:hypothetical protein